MGGGGKEEKEEKEEGGYDTFPGDLTLHLIVGYPDYVRIYVIPDAVLKNGVYEKIRAVGLLGTIDKYPTYDRATDKLIRWFRRITGPDGVLTKKYYRGTLMEQENKGIVGTKYSLSIIHDMFNMDYGNVPVDSGEDSDRDRRRQETLPHYLRSTYRSPPQVRRRTQASSSPQESQPPSQQSPEFPLATQNSPGSPQWTDALGHDDISLSTPHPYQLPPASPASPESPNLSPVPNPVRDGDIVSEDEDEDDEIEDVQEFGSDDDDDDED